MRKFWIYIPKRKYRTPPILCKAATEMSANNPPAVSSPHLYEEPFKVVEVEKRAIAEISK